MIVVLIKFMIENYKGWDISLNWSEKNILEDNTYYLDNFKQRLKWKGVDLEGNSIYGSSLKQIRHIIDYPILYKKMIN